MKILSKLYLKKIALVIVASTVLCISFINTGFAQDANNNGKEEIEEFYNPNSEKQSVLYEFLHESSVLELMMMVLQKNDSYTCDYCHMLKVFNKKPLEGLAELYQTLGFNLNDKNCNLCEFWSRMHFFGIPEKIHLYISKLHDEEYLDLKKLDKKVAEEFDEFFDFVSNLSLQENQKLHAEGKLNDMFDKLYNKIKALGNFPVLLDYIMLKKNKINDFQIFVKNVIGQKSEMLLFPTIKALIKYQKLINDNYDFLLAIEAIANNRFKIKDNDTATVSKIKTLAEMIHEGKRLQNLAMNQVDFSGQEFEKETSYSQDVNEFYNPNSQKQSVLFHFLSKRFYIELMLNDLKSNDSCDYCQMLETFNIKPLQGLPELYKVLGFNLEDKNCDLCKFWEQIPFLGLNKKVLLHVMKLHEEEYDTLREIDRGLAEELNNLLTKTGLDEAIKLHAEGKLNDRFEKLYSRINALGYDNFPNILDQLMIAKSKTIDYLNFEKEAFRDRALFMEPMVEALISYNKLVNDNYDFLLEIEAIANHEFTIIDATGKTRKTKNLSELMREGKKMEKILRIKKLNLELL